MDNFWFVFHTKNHLFHAKFCVEMDYLPPTPLIERRRRQRERFTYRYVASNFKSRQPFSLPPRLKNSGREFGSVVPLRTNSNRNERTRLYQTERTDSNRNERVIEKKGVLWVVVTTVATCLLLFQLSSVSDQYFQYMIETRVVYSQPIRISMPSVALCFDAISMINLTEFQSKFPNKKMDGQELSQTLTISDIFNSTPSNDTIMLECKYKTNISFALQYKKGLECYEIFQVMKYQKLHKLCYDIRSIDYWLFLAERVSQGLEEPGTFIDFSLNETLFTNVSSFTVTIHNHDREPRGTLMFPSYVDRHGESFFITSPFNRSLAVNETNDMDGNGTEIVPLIDKNVTASQLFINSFTFSFAIFCNYYQPAPYPPNCLDYESIPEAKYDSQDQCKDACLQYHLQNASVKFPDSVLVLEQDVLWEEIDGNRVVFSSLDYANSTLVQILARYRTFCDDVCKRPDCEEKFYDTHNMDSGSNDGFFISVFSHKTLPFYTYYCPMILFPQFLVQFLSCFGIWLTVDFTTLIQVLTMIYKFFAVRISTK